jgi:3-deoxy-D-manno-octulosonate 8-phosphate phosphatase (KDO 8-P phosphatase)
MTLEMNIRLIISDIDGVWTDGRIIYTSENSETKEFNVRDGLAVKIAQKAAIEVAVVTSRHSRALERRCRELGIKEVVQGAGDKLDEVLRIATKLNIPIEDVCYIGDDLPDLAPMMTVGLSAAPSDAAPEVFKIAKRKLTAAGGQGAFRELVETILKERGDWDRFVSDFYAAKITSQNI